MITAADLDRALRRAGIPIVGVTLGDPEDRTTWAVSFAEGATPAQQTAANTLLQSYDTTADAAKVDEDAAADLDQSKALKAVVLWAAQKLNVAPAAARAQILALYKSL